LLTGDGELPALADADGVDFFGGLWILDHLFDRGAMEAAIIFTGPEAIAAHPRCRLPRAEIQVRLKPSRTRGDWEVDHPPIPAVQSPIPISIFGIRQALLDAISHALIPL
jgi:hypothetical protein